jgi:hypothetical protein
LKEIDPAFEILHGKVLNWDVVINDMDDDNSFSWIAWGPRALKHSNVNRKGDLIFWEDAIPGLGVLKGQITRADNGQELKRVQVRVQSKVYEPTQIVLSTNQRGEFWAALPEGNYIVEAMDRVSEIRVADGDTVAVDLRMSPPKGKKVLAKGSSQVAGIGTRNYTRQVGNFTHI